MKSSLQSLFHAVLLLALFLAPGRLTAQEPQGAQSPAATPEQPPAVPDLVDLIPLATALTGRLTNLEKTIADKGDRSRVEQQLGEISALVDEYARQLPALQASIGQRAGQLPALKAEIDSAGDTLTGISKSVTEQVRTFGNLRKEWLTEQQQWNAWQAALRKEESLEEITITVTKTQGAIDTALSLLLQQLKPLLALQEQAGTLQTRINTLTAEVEGLISLTQGGVLVDASPAMFSTHYVSQLAVALRAGVHTGLVQVSWPGKAFFARQGWTVVLQGVFSLVLALVFVRRRQQLEQVEHWRFIAKRPIAAGLL
jgi:prefoldin subunit 5